VYRKGAQFIMNPQRFGVLCRLLRGDDIALAVERKYLVIAPFDKSRIQPTSYDICVSRIVEFQRQDVYQADQQNEVLFKDFEEVILEPGQSMLFLTLEEFAFPSDMLASINLRSTYSRLLNSGESMGRIECGWAGHLVLEISNQSISRRVRISRFESLASIEVYQIDEPVAKLYSGRYLNWPVSK
jgi:deoxycytidine triphosphate deaminase